MLLHPFCGAWATYNRQRTSMVTSSPRSGGRKVLPSPRRAGLGMGFDARPTLWSFGKKSRTDGVGGDCAGLGILLAHGQPQPSHRLLVIQTVHPIWSVAMGYNPTYFEGDFFISRRVADFGEIFLSCKCWLDIYP